MPDRPYSFARALRALADPANASREAQTEIDRARVEARGQPRGIVVPGDELVRALSTATGDGAELVGERVTRLEGALRTATVTGRAGATMLTGLRGDALLASITSGPATAWVNEGAAPGGGAPQVAAQRLTPKTLAAAVTVSRRMILQADRALAQLVAADIFDALAVELDAAALGGSADAGAPAGLRQALAAGKSDWAVGSPTAAEIVALEKAAFEGGARDLGYVIGPDLMATLRTTEIAGAGAPMIATEDMIMGRPAFVTPALPAGEIIVGGWRELIVATWSGIDLRLDRGGGAASDAVILRAFVDAAIGVRRTGTFAYGGPAA